MYEVWGEGSDYKELEEAIMGYPDDRKLPYLSSDSTFKITVDSFGKVISFQEQNDRIVIHYCLKISHKSEFILSCHP